MSVQRNAGDQPAHAPRVFRINTGSCNGCDVELATTALPRFDLERLGCSVCSTPADADIVLLTGPLTVRMKDAVLRAWAAVPEPRVTVALGVCPISGGIFRDGYAVCAPIDQFIPIDVNVAGCPPRPQAIVQGIAEAVTIWRERL
jgi:Ni,Fe-hydrogenase III small subunit